MIEEKVHFYKLNIKIGINNIKIKQYKSINAIPRKSKMCLTTDNGNGKSLAIYDHHIVKTPQIRSLNKLRRTDISNKN